MKMTRSEFDLEPPGIARWGNLAAEAIAADREGLLQRPVFDRVGDMAPLFDEGLPEEGLPFEDVLAFVRKNVLPHPTGSHHPRYYGFVNSSADPVGVVADYLAAAMNTNCWGGDHAANHVEKTALEWVAELLGLPPETEGVLVSGGSTANWTALAAARRALVPDVREEGLGRPGSPPPTIYASDQVHSCVDKAVDLLGFGTRRLRKIPTGSDFRLRVDLLAEAVAADRQAGFRPAIVVANAGTVNTGAIDPLDELADFCRREDLWFHVDGAYGALARLSPAQAPKFSGMERADSLAADPHKWLFVPFGAGAAFVRRPGALSAAFRKFPEYLDTSPDAPLSGPVWFAERGIELSRSFRALKIWMGLKVHGRRAYAEAIDRNVELARVLSEAVDRAPDLERLSEPELSIANFRYRPAGSRMSEDELNDLNRRIIHRIVENGSAFVYPTVLHGRTSIRVCIVNFRTDEKDVSALVGDVVRWGSELAAGRSAAKAGAR